MHGVRTRFADGVDHAIDPQVALARRAGTDLIRFVGEPHVKRRAIALGVHDHRRDAELAARANHAHGNLAAVGYEDLLHTEFNYVGHGLQAVPPTVASV